MPSSSTSVGGTIRDEARDDARRYHLTEDTEQAISAVE